MCVSLSYFSFGFVPSLFLLDIILSFAVADAVMGTLVELATVLYLYRVFRSIDGGVSKLTLGIFEWFSVFFGLLSVVFAAIGIAQYDPFALWQQEDFRYFVGA